MRKLLVFIGLISGLIILTGLFTPWMGINSSPYRPENREFSVQDKTTITGYDLVIGEYNVKRRNFSSGEVLQVREMKGPTKFYPFLVIVGGLLAVGGGIISLYIRRVPMILIVIGCFLAFLGTVWGIVDTRWVRLKTITFGNYSFSGYWEYGLVIILASSISGSIAALTASSRSGVL